MALQDLSITVLAVDLSKNAGMKTTAYLVSLAILAGAPSSCPGQDANPPAAASAVRTNVGGLYSGLIYPADGVVPERSGYFKIKVSKGGRLSGRMRLGKKNARFAGRFNEHGIANLVAYNKTKEECEETGWTDHNGVWHPGDCDRKLTWILRLELSTDGEEIRGAVIFARGAGWTADLHGHRDGLGGQNNPAPPGKYTILLPGSAEPQASPAGHGYGTITVNAKGNVRLTGVLPDGSKISQGGVISRNGVWALSVPTHGGHGTLMGWVTFEPGPESDLTGLLQWIWPRRAARTYYSEGFSVETAVTGSRYAPPASGLSPWNWVNGTVELDGGNLSEPITGDVEFGGGNQLIPVAGALPQFKLKVQSATGAFSGSFLHPETGRTSSCRGVVLQKQNLGAGFFLGSSQSGYVLVKPTQ
jgi:hypothetical protein